MHSNGNKLSRTAYFILFNGKLATTPIITVTKEYSPKYIMLL